MHSVYAPVRSLTHSFTSDCQRSTPQERFLTAAAPYPKLASNILPSKTIPQRSLDYRTIKGLPAYEVFARILIQPEHAEGIQNLLRFVQIVLGNIFVVYHNEQVVRQNGSVIPVEAAVDDDVTINHTLF